MATITATATEILTATVTETVASASASSSLRAAPQGGVLEGGNPSEYDPKNPIIIFIIQAGIIIMFCRLLHYPLSLLRQPRVIAEVIGGILLGPSVMGHVPGFTDAIFPKESIPNLTLVANLGLVLFLFLVGLEVDLRYFVSNWRVALSVGTAGMALPFGLGCAIAWGIYHEFQNDPGTVHVAFGTFMLFIGVAMAITAFPVLCRILTELKLLSTPVGVIVLSAGVSNDVVGWILLALCVALVNSGSGITALWILLCCVGYTLFLVFAVRPAFIWLLRRTNALHDGPSQSIVALTLMIALTSAFFTGSIGVHPIFGAFLAGLICPHEGGFAIHVTEKVEDLVSSIFLPLYFALSGLSTNLGLLNNGITWAYVVAIIAVAFSAKFIGGTLGAKLNGLVWRESFTIGVLMSCKGLVELIVLNIGLQAKILSTRTFTMFVVMALVTTFATTPLTSALYPPWYQSRIQAWKRGEIDWDSGKARGDGTNDYDGSAKDEIASSQTRSLLVYLRLDNMATLLAFVSLFGSRVGDSVPQTHPSHRRSKDDVGSEARITRKQFTPQQNQEGANKKPVELHGVRLLELTERGSSVMKVSEVEEYSAFDPILNAFRVLGQLYSLAISGEVAVVPQNTYADTLINKAVDESSDLLLLPWSETGSLSEAQTITTENMRQKLSSDAYSSFVTKIFAAAQCNCGVFVNKGFSGTLKQRPTAIHRALSVTSISSHREQTKAFPRIDRSHHVFMPFFGGSDCRLGLRLVLQLLANPDVTATIVKYEFDEQATSEAAAVQETVVMGNKEQRNTQSDPAHGDVTMLRSAAVNVDDNALLDLAQKSLPAEVSSRVLFETVSTNDPLRDARERAEAEVAQKPKNGGDVIVMGRNVDRFQTESNSSITCLGRAADTFAASGIRASLLVVQAKPIELE